MNGEEKLPKTAKMISSLSYKAAANDSTSPPPAQKPRVRPSTAKKETPMRSARREKEDEEVEEAEEETPKAHRRRPSKQAKPQVCIN